VHVRAEELALLRFTACVHCITLVAWPGGVVLRESVSGGAAVKVNEQGKGSESVGAALLAMAESGLIS